MSLCDAVPVLYFKGEVAMPPMISAAALEESPVALQRPITEINLLKRIKLIAIAAPLILAVCSTACHQNRTSQPQTASRSRNLPVMQVSVGAPVEYTTVGSVVSDQRIDVTTRLSGYIRAVLVQEGDRVRRGQVLVRLDTSDVEASIRQAQAGVSAAEAAFRDAEVDRGHFQQLFEHGTISDNEFRKVVLKDEAAHETLKQARAALDMACAQREYAAIKSPVDGTVVARSKLVGDLAVPGVPILTLESEYGLLFEAFVDVGVDKESLAAPTPFIRSWTPSGRRPKSPSIRNRGAELGTTRTDHPGLLGDEPGFRIAKTYGGVAASFVSQKGQKVVSRTNFLK